ncbi:MAG: AmmeMemoRadiSam system protein B [Bacteroidia bacterium]|nr:AmmeMemoRadiSam system protein B [Bacteroidia bacterium]
MANSKTLAPQMRPLIDKVGFPHTMEQTEAFIARVKELSGDQWEARRNACHIKADTSWKVAICPHDDYSYVGYLYPLVLQNLKSKTVFIFGVAHKAGLFNLSDNLIFDDFATWHGIKNPVPVSGLRKALLAKIPETSYEVHQPMQQAEHSVEAMLPILQYYNNEAEIVPILVPPMPFDKMTRIAAELTEAIAAIASERHLKWGEDFSMLITTDAVHYGDQGWGNNNQCKRFGVDKEGYMETVEFENHLIDDCLAGRIDESHLHAFFDQTVDSANYQLHKWPWCGRYSVPFGLLTMYKLAKKMNLPVPEGKLLGYSTSITHDPVPVADLGGMGVTAPANLRHWVGYAALGYV